MAHQIWKFFAGIGLKASSAPTTPENGDIYYDSTVNAFRFYQNGAFTGFLQSSAHVGTTPEVGGSSPYQLTVAHKRTQIINTGGIIRLPSSSVAAGDIWQIVNRSTTELDIQTSSGNSIDKIYTGSIIVAANAATPTASANWTIMDVHEYVDSSVTFSFTGAGTSSISLRIVRDNKQVVVHFPDTVTKTSMSTGSITANLPASRFYPSKTSYTWAFMRDNGSDTSGAIKIDTSGNITFFRTLTSTFSGGGSSTGLQNGIAVTYSAA